MHLFYLHGFASSARSTKAAYLAAKLGQHGLVLHTPDFNQPDFSTLTVTRMIEQTRRAIHALDDRPVVLIGSSMGAFVAIHTAVAEPQRIGRLVLLAPALDFGRRGDIALGDRTHEEWRSTGQTQVFHYGFGRVMPVHYALYADASAYASAAVDVRVPIQIFQGRNDSVVDPAAVEQWAAGRPNVQLHILEDDHQLGSSLDLIWREVSRFVGLSV